MNNSTLSHNYPHLSLNFESNNWKNLNKEEWKSQKIIIKCLSLSLQTLKKTVLMKIIIKKIENDIMQWFDLFSGHYT